jgi:hypothetical protein
MSKMAKTAVAATQRGYNTNLASEFYVLSMLYRLGFDANLTLGNKKSVDIAVVLGPGHAITVDVKAVAGKWDWLMGSAPDSEKPNHHVVLVSYEGRFEDAQQAPRCWVLRHKEILPLVKTASGKGRMRYELAEKLVQGDRQIVDPVLPSPTCVETIVSLRGCSAM